MTENVNDNFTVFHRQVSKIDGKDYLALYLVVFVCVTSKQNNFKTEKLLSHKKFIKLLIEKKKTTSHHINGKK